MPNEFGIGRHVNAKLVVFRKLIRRVIASTRRDRHRGCNRCNNFSTPRMTKRDSFLFWVRRKSVIGRVWYSCVHDLYYTREYRMGGSRFGKACMRNKSYRDMIAMINLAYPRTTESLRAFRMNRLMLGII